MQPIGGMLFSRKSKMGTVISLINSTSARAVNRIYLRMEEELVTDNSEAF
jgi:hypothetical protein